MRGIADLYYELGQSILHCYFHRVTVTLVPSEAREITSNSFTNLFAPPKPRPKPEPVVKPSRRAKLDWDAWALVLQGKTNSDSRAIQCGQLHGTALAMNKRVAGQFTGSGPTSMV